MCEVVGKKMKTMSENEMMYLQSNGYREKIETFIECYSDEPCLWQIKISITMIVPGKKLR